MSCEKCGKEIDIVFGSGRFCSRKCANSHFRSDESRKKTSLAIKRRTERGERWGCMAQTKEQRLEQAKKNVEVWNNKVLAEDFATIKTSSRRRKRIILEQNGKCHKCGISEWNGKRITLEVDHINGNHNDNARENLVAICPNCHSQTPTWRGRNTSVKRNEKSNQELYDAFIKSDCNTRQALLSLGMAGAGDNYRRMAKAIDTYR